MSAARSSLPHKRFWATLCGEYAPSVTKQDGWREERRVACLSAKFPLAYAPESPAIKSIWPSESDPCGPRKAYNSRIHALRATRISALFCASQRGS